MTTDSEFYIEQVVCIVPPNFSHHLQSLGIKVGNLPRFWIVDVFPDSRGNQLARLINVTDLTDVREVYTAWLMLAHEFS